MVRRSIAAALALTVLHAGCATTTERTSHEVAVQELATANASVRQIIDELAVPLIKGRRNIGMVVAVTTPAGDIVLPYGSTDLAGKNPMPRGAVFQVGSVSKSFAAILAAELEREHRIALDAPVSKLLPKQLKLASAALGDITLAELATHTSGLPHEAYTLSLLWGVVSYLVSGKNLYRYFDQKVLEDYLSAQSYQRPEQKKYAYSNIGYTYFGWLIGQVDHKGYGNWLREKVIHPLGLSHTGLATVADGGKDLTPGYSGDLPTFVPRHRPVEPWLFDEGIAGPGGVTSTADDLLTYTKANMGLIATTLYPAMLATHAPRVTTDFGKIGLAWFIKTLPHSAEPFTSCEGIVGGHTSFVGFDREHRIGVVVLQNSINHDDMVGVELLDRLVGARQVAAGSTKIFSEARAKTVPSSPRTTPETSASGASSLVRRASTISLPETGNGRSSTTEEMPAR